MRILISISMKIISSGAFQSWAWMMCVQRFNEQKEIMKVNKDNGKSLIRHGGYEYYEDNPALTMHEAVEKILVECGLY